MSISTKLPELLELERLLERGKEKGRVKTLREVKLGSLTFPQYSIVFGPDDPKLPILAMFGGVHGLERIGTHILNSYLRSFLELYSWDTLTQEALKKSRVAFFPLVNPGGMYLQVRSNPRGVDLMRNAPVEAEAGRNWQLYRGQRFSKKLPWFRGEVDAPMEVESQGICQFIREEVLPSTLAISLDVHSGYGAVDRLWFPYAKSNQPIKHLPEVYLLKKLLDETYPQHVYCIEPQSRQYSTHGDLWDYLYDEQVATRPDQLFLPLSLELGSWVWVKKNPKQLFSLLGAFNPLAPHRYLRILRRHLILVEFLHRAVLSPRHWALEKEDERHEARKHAMAQWYET